MEAIDVDRRTGVLAMCMLNVSSHIYEVVKPVQTDI